MSGPPPAPGQQPTPQQMAMIQQQFMQEAQKRGMTPQQFQAAQRRELEEQAKKAGMTFEQYIDKLKRDVFEQHQKQQQEMASQAAQQQSGQPSIQQGGPGGPQQQQGQQVPITPGAPDPKALALAKWLRSQDLKPRTCLLNGQRKDMFRVKRALRAIRSPAYTAACKKTPLLPPVTETMNVPEIFKLLPLSLLALRVSKSDPHAGHNHAPPPKPQKRTKGLWTVKIEQQQDIADDLHYVWLYEGPQWKTKLYAGGALAAIMAVVMFPLWPMKLRLGVWYLSMGAVGLIGLFFAMAIVRLILFCATVFTIPPGLWLYPNLFEDVGFFDSFRPVWGWQEDKNAKKAAKKAKKAEKEAKASKGDKPAPVSSVKGEATGNATSSATAPVANGKKIQARAMPASVEEADDD